MVSFRKLLSRFDQCATTAAAFAFGIVKCHAVGHLARTFGNTRVMAAHEKRFRFDDAAATALAFVRRYRWLDWSKMRVVAANEAFEYLTAGPTLQPLPATARAFGHLSACPVNRFIGRSRRTLGILELFTPSLLRGVKDWAGGLVGGQIPCPAFST